MSLSNFLNGVQNATKTLNEIAYPTGGFEAPSEFSGAPISLGDFYFDEWETPESIRHGMTQDIVVHPFPGGGEVIDVMGGREKPIEWSGRFFGDGHEERARLLKAQCERGKRVTLAWGQWDYDVIIIDTDFEERFGQTLYSIVCKVADKRQPGANQPGLAQVLSSDLTTASGMLGAGSLSDQLKGAKGLLGAVTSTASTAVGFIDAVTSVKSEIDTRLASANNMIRNIGSLGGIADAADTVSKLRSLKSAAQDVSNLGGTTAYLGRALNNAKKGLGR